MYETPHLYNGMTYKLPKRMFVVFINDASVGGYYALLIFKYKCMGKLMTDDINQLSGNYRQNDVFVVRQFSFAEDCLGLSYS